MRTTTILALSLTLGCNPSQDLDLVETWSAQFEGFANGVHAGRSIDTNADGAVDNQDAMQLWINTGHMDGPLIGIDHTGAIFAELPYYSLGIADLDESADGMEVFVASDDGDVALHDENGEIWRVEGAADAGGHVTLTDLEGDGRPEALVGSTILDATTGSRIATLGVPSPEVGERTHNVAADLDRDGIAEIISATQDNPQVSLHSADGSQLAVCAESQAKWAWTEFAVGNLDSDPDGEFVAAGKRFVAICDSDGSVLAEVDVGTVQPVHVGLAQLDDDDGPEILIGQNDQLMALDDDLSVLWRYSVANGSWYPFSVADLDGDGLHEALVHVNQELHIVDADGVALSETSVTPGNGSASWQSQPIVVDLDADGCAEIVVGDSGSVVAFGSSDGCWQIESATQPWSGIGRFPGDRTGNGGIGAPEPFWLQNNVWQGLP